MRACLPVSKPGLHTKVTLASTTKSSCYAVKLLKGIFLKRDLLKRRASGIAPELGYALIRLSTRASIRFVLGHKSTMKLVKYMRVTKHGVSSNYIQLLKISTLWM